MYGENIFIHRGNELVRLNINNGLIISTPFIQIPFGLRVIKDKLFISRLHINHNYMLDANGNFDFSENNKIEEVQKVCVLPNGNFFDSHYNYNEHPMQFTRDELQYATGQLIIDDNNVCKYETNDVVKITDLKYIQTDVDAIFFDFSKGDIYYSEKGNILKLDWNRVIIEKGSIESFKKHIRLPNLVLNTKCVKNVIRLSRLIGRDKLDTNKYVVLKLVLYEIFKKNIKLAEKFIEYGFSKDNINVRPKVNDLFFDLVDN